METFNLVSTEFDIKDVFGKINSKKFNIAATNELETALSSYKSICANLPGQPIWAVAENYRFEPAFLEVLVSVIFERVPIALACQTLIVASTVQETNG